MTTKKGIAVLTDGGAVAHKLLDDGSAQLGLGTSQDIVMSGSVKLENLNVVTKTANGATTMVDAGTAGANAADDMEKAINGVSGSLAVEISEASTRRTQLNTAIEELQTASGLVDDGAVSTRVDSSLNGQQLDFAIAYGDARYIAGATSLVNADELLDAEIAKQERMVAHFEAADTVGPTTIDGITTDGSIRYQIGQLTGALSGQALDTLAEMSSSLGGDDNAVTTMLGRLQDAIDELDGVTDNQVSDTLFAVEEQLKSERVRRKGTNTDDNTITPHLTTGGQQGLIQERIDEIQAALGSQADGNLDPVSEDKPAARDIELARALKVMETRMNYLENTDFSANAITISGATTVSGHMKFTGADASFRIPVLNATEAAALTNNSQYNGQVFYLNAHDINDSATLANTPFEDAQKLYFCENGVWHSSYLLKE